MNKPSREFLGPIILSNATTVNTCHCMFFQTQSIKALQNVQGKYILWKKKKQRFQLLLQNTHYLSIPSFCKLFADPQCNTKSEL